jgi:hypothetical protein
MAQEEAPEAPTANLDAPAQPVPQASIAPAPLNPSFVPYTQRDTAYYRTVDDLANLRLRVKLSRLPSQVVGKSLRV